MRLFLCQVGLLGLLAAPAWAQQPVLPSAPQPTTSPSTAPPVPTLAVPDNMAPTEPRIEIVGQSYSVELKSGTNFLGKLLTTTSQELTFETKDLGTVTVQRANLRQLTLLTSQQASRGFDDVGNGTRMFFAPTARGLRRGEGYVQDIDIILAGVNYGVTDNFSVGLLVPIIPNSGLTIVAITPKISAPITDKLSLGVGALYAVVTGFNDSATGGIGYGVATYGTSDSNVTFGLGYGFAKGGVSSSPVAVVGGNLRVSRRLFLVDETYIASGGVAGLLGLRVAAARASGSIGVLYSGQEVVPAYLEFAYRFGKTVVRRR